MTLTRFLGLWASFLFFTLSQATTNEAIFPSECGRPIKQSFFHRSGAKAPIFLQCGQNFGNMYNFFIRLHDASLPSDIPPEEKRRLLTSCTQAGFLSVDLSGELLNISTLHVRQDMQGQGYGTHALLTLLGLYKKKVPTTLRYFTLSVRDGHGQQERLLSFYEKIGFKRGSAPGQVNMPGMFINLFMPCKAFDPTKVKTKS